jgi:hypothetical protein
MEKDPVEFYHLPAVRANAGAGKKPVLVQGGRMRNMSFFLTTRQIQEGTKTVTRRIGWKNLKPGEHFMAVVKSQGLKKGEKIEKIRELVCVSNKTERLGDIIDNPYRGSTIMETDKEGFPHLTPEGFVRMLYKEIGANRETMVQRIEFEYI